MQHPSAVTKNPLIRAVITLLPRRMKRIVFLASLTAIAKETTVPDKWLIEKLNRSLSLCSTGDAALKLPIHCSQLIWSNQQVFKEDIQKLSASHEDDTGATESAERIATATPEWFSYDDRSTVIKDIIALFSQASCIFPNDTRLAP